MTRSYNARAPINNAALSRTCQESTASTTAFRETRPSAASTQTMANGTPIAAREAAEMKTNWRANVFADRCIAASFASSFSVESVSTRYASREVATTSNRLVSTPKRLARTTALSERKSALA